MSDVQLKPPTVSVELLVALPDRTWYTEVVDLVNETLDTVDEDLLSMAGEIFEKRHPGLEVSLLTIYHLSFEEEFWDEEESLAHADH